MSKSPDGPISRFEVITSVKRRRRWSAAEKVRFVEDAMQPKMSGSFVVRQIYSPPHSTRGAEQACGPYRPHSCCGQLGKSRALRRNNRLNSA
jgi:hypothetical protein